MSLEPRGESLSALPRVELPAVATIAEEVAVLQVWCGLGFRARFRGGVVVVTKNSSYTPPTHTTVDDINPALP